MDVLTVLYDIELIARGSEKQILLDSLDVGEFQDVMEGLQTVAEFGACYDVLIHMHTMEVEHG